MTYAISDRCIGCTACADLCPEGAIIPWGRRFRILGERCQECAGSYDEPQCVAVCPVEEALLDGFGTPVHPPGSLTGIPVTLLERSGALLRPRQDVLTTLARRTRLPLPGPMARPLHHMLRPHQSPRPGAELFSRMLDSWWSGMSVLPDYLGLDPGEFRAMTAWYYPSLELPAPVRGARGDTRRWQEVEDLALLLTDHALLPESPALARLIAWGCLGEDHLWQDLGLWSRGDLGLLLHLNFPSLAAKNTGDMKWKKFFYKQLCESEGLRTCRAPSCQVCGDYAACFGPEE